MSVRDRRPLLYDLARIQRGQRVAHTIESTRALATALGADESRLPAAIQRVLGSRAVDRRAGNGEWRPRRRSDPSPIESCVGARTGWSEEFDQSLREWLSTSGVGDAGQRVLLVGSVPSDDAFTAPSKSMEPSSWANSTEASTVAGRNDRRRAVEIIARRYTTKRMRVSTLASNHRPTLSRRRAPYGPTASSFGWSHRYRLGLASASHRTQRCWRQGLPTLMPPSQPPTR